MNISRKAMKIIELAQKIANKRGISVEEAWSEAVTEYKNKYEHIAYIFKNLEYLVEYNDFK
ncbi:hypothetical protein BM533_17650 [Clostridioides difficile]|nr:hypothetical protein [Clostridioides difficile]OJT85241.1 hypothetical protein BM533_17650 [Clostridioides difficile]HBF9554697.1 hypothetical protein [Clostridioides difficile]HDF2338183.1 hypothetical protein [Clostridioides difficile]